MYFVHTLQKQRVEYVVATCYVLYCNFTDSISITQVLNEQH